MKITTNSIGNYSPRILKNNEAASLQKEQAVTEQKSIIDKNEKKFFAEMYPNNKKEVMNYHFYQKSGAMSGVSVGSLLDRRG